MLLLVNGFGATPLIELYLMVNSAKRILDGAGITGDALSDRILCHSPRHGRRLGHRIRARRPGEGTVGCAGAHRGAALGRLIKSSLSGLQKHR